LHFLYKVGSRDGTRLVKDQYKVDFFVANRSRASPIVNDGKGVGINGSDCSEINDLAVAPLSSANSRSSCPDIGYFIARNSIMSTTYSVDSCAVTSRITVVILRHGGGPSLSMTRSAI
jgi:hypothetical protein